MKLEKHYWIKSEFFFYFLKKISLIKSRVTFLKERIIALICSDNCVKKLDLNSSYPRLSGIKIRFFFWYNENVVVNKKRL